MRNEHLNLRIYLADSKISGLHEVFHKAFENLVFFRWMFFKNRPRSTFILFRSFLITGIFCCLYYAVFSNFKFIVIGVDVDPVLIFGFMGIVGYWQMLKGFYDKNNYCSNLYNEVVKERARGHHQSADLLSTNLSVQLLIMDLWSHRIYSSTFVEFLEKAIEFTHSKENIYTDQIFETQKECIRTANNRELTVRSAREMLLAYQHYLEDQIRQGGRNNNRIKKNAG